ncbi:hypothetical protein CDAR_620571 [Caerostris darwini]|uniref:Uncharacterized protein n=1 Tax=Caerostris darwini TaxID=1538125 RepID=A0AAV4PYA5_9ARAC|nr:hypothetical protein CDAR_620571 [Caerostris darwini]
MAEILSGTCGHMASRRTSPMLRSSNFYWGRPPFKPRESLISCGRLYTGISVIHRPLQSGFPAADKSGAFSSPLHFQKGPVSRGNENVRKGGVLEVKKGHVSGGNAGIFIK